ncbi:MAG TPA: iron ABC transporter permease [Stellaceae bacterium]|jgi:iron(III) transport system permease protein|nr:iron ABC transporter permease [Stellaceae bacterium]
MASHAEIAAVAPPAPPRTRIDIWPGAFFAAVIAASIVILALLAIVIGLSFRTGSLGASDAAWSLANYPTIFLDNFTYRVLGNTIGFALTTLLVALVFGVPIAWLVERSDLPGKPLLFTLMAIGLLLPGFGSAMGWLFLMHPRIGLVNVWIQQHFHVGPVFNIASVVGMGWVQGLSLAPLAFIMTAAVFRASDPALEEAAQMAGARFFTRMRRVTLPLAWPGVLAAGIYIFTIGFAAFDVPAIIGWSNRVFTFSTYLVLQLSPTDALPRYGNAATLSVMLLGFAGFFSWWYAKMQKGAHRYQVVRGKAYRPQLLALGWFTAPAWCLISLYLILATLLPLLVVIWASVLPYFQLPSATAFASASFARYAGLPWELITDGLTNTLILMVLTPTVTLALAVCFSWVVLRSRLPGRGWFDFVAFLPHAMPNIIFGIGALLIALFVIQRFVPAFGTLWLLLIAFIVGRISYATRMTNTGLIQIHKELEESGEVGGATTGGVIMKIVVPLLAPTLLNAWLWIALLTFRELTLAVLLTTRDNMTLPVVIWSLWLGGGLGDAAAVALVMLCGMIPIIGLYWLVARKTGLHAG